MQIILKSASKLSDDIKSLFIDPPVSIDSYLFLGFSAKLIEYFISQPILNDKSVLELCCNHKFLPDAPYHSSEDILYADYDAASTLNLPLNGCSFLTPGQYNSLANEYENLESLEDYASYLNTLIAKSINSDLVEASVSFSGGVDCTLIAANLLNQGVSKINLITVCVGENSFDEVNSKNVVSDLKKHFKDCEIVHKLIKIDHKEASEVRSTLKTFRAIKQDVMNLNIATCHFIVAKNLDQDYIFTGTGADELFGGYHRLKTKMQHGGYEAVQEDLREAIVNLSQNNLFRDFEVYAYFNKKLVHPLLSNEIIKLSSKLLNEQKCPLFSAYNGIPGDKIVVRLALKQILSIPTVSTPKKAIQFSTKIASLDKGAKGTDKL